MPNDECPVTWPTVATQGDLLPPYLRPKHVCRLPADHIHNFEAWRHVMPAVQPHECACHATLPVRDVEVSA